ncbi:large ribosomal subunit protein mL55-like [Montipora foliosa]|uniref:large ribosomal subunit protein mL55-like n=1 Tax=Montipora foliosa TaxID=591990 RepID=UPI0035F14C41
MGTYIKMAASLRAKFGFLWRNLLLENSLNVLSLYFKRKSSICSAAITRIPKATYPRMYKVRLVQPDGSTYFIRYEEPYKIIKKPIDPAAMTEEEKRARMNRLKPEKPKKIYEMEEEEDENYNQRSWTNLIKNKDRNGPRLNSNKNYSQSRQGFG